MQIRNILLVAPFLAAPYVPLPTCAMDASQHKTHPTKDNKAMYVWASLGALCVVGTLLVCHQGGPHPNKDAVVLEDRRVDDNKPRLEQTMATVRHGRTTLTVLNQVRVYSNGIVTIKINKPRKPSWSLANIDQLAMRYLFQTTWGSTLFETSIALNQYQKTFFIKTDQDTCAKIHHVKAMIVRTA